MKLSSKSKSILSPSRSREPRQMSLSSSSFSRRLGSNGSIKGGTGQASPMFPTGVRKRGSGFENPEPSSPKVTCIGQVRVKTRKQGKKMRSSSKRRGEASFRRTEQSFQVAVNPDLVRQNSQSFQYPNHQNLQQEGLPHRNQRWVHLPFTICEALRAFGAEFSCLFPCRSSCMSTEREKEGKVATGGGGGGEEGSGGGHGRKGSCGAAFVRWLVTLQDGDTKDSREIELMMEEEGRSDRPERSQRRHVFEDIDIIDVEKTTLEEEEKARVSICIPPKNALLLMRCRSDPVKMAALANRFWEPTVHKEDEDDDGQDNRDDKEQEEEEHVQMEEDKDKQVQIKIEKDNNISESEKEVAFVDGEEYLIPEEAEAEVEGYEIESSTNPEMNEVPEANQEVKEEEEDGDDEDAAEGNAISNGQEETFSSAATSPEVQIDLENPETEEFQVQPILLQEMKEKENEEESSEIATSSPAVCVPAEPKNDAFAEAVAAEEEGSTEDEEKGTSVAEKAAMKDEESIGKVTTQDGSEPHDPNLDPESKEREMRSKLEREGQSGRLPECLLLMMCEPKVSMEVSRETWVCGTDFIRRLPEKHVRKTNGADRERKKRVSVDSKPPRSSCSFPAPSMATMIEQKLVGSNNNGYEPFVLTRCKSEPMRSSSKLSPEACFWNNRKLEPHPPPATLGVGAAGVGF